jgi:hypothetical protein
MIDFVISLSENVLTNQMGVTTPNLRLHLVKENNNLAVTPEICSRMRYLTVIKLE